MDDSLNNGLVITSIYQNHKKIAIALVDVLIKKIKGKQIDYKMIEVSLKKVKQLNNK